MSDYKRISGQIKTIANRGAALDKLIQSTGLDVLKHIEEHGEVSLACKLFLAMPNGSRRNSLAHWLLSYGKVKLNVDAKGKSDKAIPFAYAKDKTTDLEGAKGKAWYDAKKEKSLDEEFNLDDSLGRFLKTVAKAVEQGKLAADNPKVVALRQLAGVE